MAAETEKEGLDARVVRDDETLQDVGLFFQCL